MNETESKINALQESVSQLWKGLWTNRRGYRAILPGALTMTAYTPYQPVSLQVYTSSEHTALNGWLHITAKGSGSGTVTIQIISDHSGQTTGYNFPVTTASSNYFIPFYLPLVKGWTDVKGALCSNTAFTISAGAMEMVGTLVNIK